MRTERVAQNVEPVWHPRSTSGPLDKILDHLRGCRGETPGVGSERVARQRYTIEHVMPRQWIAHWPLPSSTNEYERDQIVHTIGNLTLLTAKLNSKVSNGSWDGKRVGLEDHDTFFLNSKLLKAAGDNWTDDLIRARTTELVDVIVKIWPVPPGHVSGHVAARPTVRKKRVHLSDLINAGTLEPGMPLFPRRPKFSDKAVILLPDGRVEVDGQAFPTASKAASSITGTAMNGWWFFLVDQTTKRSLRKVRADYVAAMAVDADDDEDDAE